MIRFWLILGATILLTLIFVRRYFFTLKDFALQKQVLEKDKKEKVRAEKMAQMEEPVHEQKRKAPKARPTKEINNAYRKADMLFAKAEYEEAEKVFIKVLALDDAHTDANLKLGLIYLHKGEAGKAEFFFNKLLSVKKDPVFLSNLALALYQQKRLQEAADAYEQAIVLDPRKESRFVSLAHVYRELGNEQKALENMERAAVLAPRNTDYLFTIVDGYVLNSEDDRALQTLERILMIEPYNENAKTRQQEITQRKNGIVPQTMVVTAKEEPVQVVEEVVSPVPESTASEKEPAQIEQQALPLEGK